MRLRKERVRLHLSGVNGSDLPSVEGVLVAKRRQEFILGLPSVLIEPGQNPSELESRWLVIPRERVMFYEVLK